MSEFVLLDVLSAAFRTAALVAGPALLVGLVIGLTMAVFQAATSIQDPTLSFVPRIAAVLLVVFLVFPWMLTIMRDFTLHIFQNLHTLSL